MKVQAKLDALYKQIPTFTCNKGCTDCCGPVPFAKAEWQYVENKKEATGVDCPYSTTGKCEIYSQRPFTCRLFGASTEPLLTCPHGCGPEKPLTKEQTALLMHRYQKLMEAS